MYRWANIVKEMNMPYDIQVDDQLVPCTPVRIISTMICLQVLTPGKNISGNLDYYVLTSAAGK